MNRNKTQEAKPHVVVIDPGTRVAEVDCFNHLVQLSPLKLTYQLPALFGLQPFDESHYPIAAIILLGSQSSVHNKEDWQRELTKWLLPKIQEGIPTLGICYGHQWITHNFGGKVGHLYPEKNKRLGFHRVSLEPNPLWKDQRLEGQLLFSHREVVIRCPDSMCVVGKSKDTETEAIRHKELPLWGFQAHLEATPAFLKNHGISQPAQLKIFSFGYSLLTHFFHYVAQQH